MGTYITLEVGGVEVTSSKNHLGMDHGSLFQRSDRRPIHSDQIDYEYYEQEKEDPTPMEMVFIRPLGDVVPRLEMLGFTLDRVRREYERVADETRKIMSSVDIYNADEIAALMSFDEFRDFVNDYPIESLSAAYVEVSDKEAMQAVRQRFSRSEINRIPRHSAYDVAYSERSFFAGAIDILHPYSVMRLLGDIDANAIVSVVWHYGPLLEGGYVNASDFTPEARRAEAFLIATEGSSDIHILKRALLLLRPDVADFFRFIDVQEGHPFPGTGNLVRFAEGLAKIDIQNQVLFLFDNDAEGLDAYQRMSKLILPLNMRGAMLPDVETFRRFPAQGPDGTQLVDINGRAAAIECYLDLELESYPPAKVRWTNYKKDLGVYQGALDYKESYTKAFLDQTPESINTGSYDVSKLQAVLSLMIAECTAIAVEQAQQNMSYLDKEW